MHFLVSYQEKPLKNPDERRNDVLGMTSIGIVSTTVVAVLSLVFVRGDVLFRE